MPVGRSPIDGEDGGDPCTLELCGDETAGSVVADPSDDGRADAPSATAARAALTAEPPARTTYRAGGRRSRVRRRPDHVEQDVADCDQVDHARDASLGSPGCPRGLRSHPSNLIRVMPAKGAD